MFGKWLVYLCGRLVCRAERIYQSAILIFAFSAIGNEAMGEKHAAATLLFGAILLGLLYLVIMPIALFLKVSIESYNEFVESYEKPKRLQYDDPDEQIVLDRYVEYKYDY